jgi:uncharacterized membrane protein
VLQVIVLGASAIPVAILARRRFANPWVSTALGVAWLMHPSVQYFVWETFHPEVMAIPFLLWAYLALDARRWTLGAVLLIGALLWKEDVALFVAGIGLLWILRRQVRVGAMIMALGLTWFAVFAVWFVPHEAGGTTVYGPLYGKLGDSPSEVIFRGITHPGDVIDRLGQNDAVGYARDLTVPFGFTAFAAPEVLIAGLPQFTINALTTANFTWDIRYHYQALPLAALAIAMVEGVARLSRWRPRVGTGAVVFVLATSLAATSAWGPSPIGVRYRTGYWPLAVGPEQVAKENVIAMLAGDKRGVSVDYNFAPHLAHRSVIYTFPNPWVNKNYGISPTALGDPAKVQTGLARDDRLFWWWLRKNGRYLFPAGVKDELFAGSTLLRNLTAIYFDLFLVGVLDGWSWKLEPSGRAVVIASLALLARRHVYANTLWSYAEAMRGWLRLLIEIAETVVNQEAQEAAAE